MPNQHLNCNCDCYTHYYSCSGGALQEVGETEGGVGSGVETLSAPFKTNALSIHVSALVIASTFELTILTHSFILQW